MSLFTPSSSSTSIVTASPIVREGGCVARVVADGSLEMDACERLRHRYFVQHRGWVEENPLRPGSERDSYDAHAVHLAVFDGMEAVAYLRVLPHQPHVGFMLDREFALLLDGRIRQDLPREGTAELSRLVCRTSGITRRAWHERGGIPAVELLFKLFYQTAQERGWHGFYIVVETDWLRLFNRRFGFPFQAIGCPYTFPDGTVTVAAHVSLPELETGVGRRSPDKLRWYQSIVPDAGGK